MAYADFTLESVEATCGLTARPGDLFPGLSPLPVPSWLSDLLDRGRVAAALVSEKARSEFLVTPVLLAAHDLAPRALTIYSGQRLDVDADRGLVGECDYILALTEPVPRLRAPLENRREAYSGGRGSRRAASDYSEMTFGKIGALVQRPAARQEPRPPECLPPGFSGDCGFAPILVAKKGDVEAGLGQCVAQMFAARLFNERAGEGERPVYGCVTTGEIWQFLRLEGSSATIDRTRLFIDNVGGILAVLRAVVGGV